MDRQVIAAGWLTLRPFTPADIPWVYEVSLDRELQRFMQVPSPYRLEDAASHVEQAYIAGWDGGRQAEFVAEDAATATPLGRVGLRLGEPGAAEVGYWVDPRARKRGVATTAVRAVCRWAVTTAGIELIEWRCEAGNIASLRVAEKAGFLIEATLRKRRVRHGVRVDEWVGSLLRDEVLAGPGWRPAPDRLPRTRPGRSLILRLLWRAKTRAGSSRRDPHAGPWGGGRQRRRGRHRTQLPGRAAVGVGRRAGGARGAGRLSGGQHDLSGGFESEDDARDPRLAACLHGLRGGPAGDGPVCAGRDVLGIAVLVGGPADVGVQTLAESSLFRIDSRTLTAAAHRDARVSWALAEELNRRLYESLQQTAINAFGSVRQRVAAHLLDLASAQQRPGGRLVACVSQQELADAVGSVREVVARVLRTSASTGSWRPHRTAFTSSTRQRCTTSRGRRR